MKSILSCFIVCTLVSVGVMAQTDQNQTKGSTSGQAFRKVGAAGGQFLKVAVGARANAMGGAFSAISNDLSGLFYNNAGIVDIKGYAADISYTQWFGGYSHNFLAGVIPVGDKYRVALSVTSFSSGDIPFTTVEDGGRLGLTYQVADFAIGGTFSAFLTEQFSFGVTAKYIQNSIASMNANGIVLDIGTLYRFSGYRVGFSISNLGPQMTYSGQNQNLKIQPIPGLQQQTLDAQLSSSAFNLPLAFKAGIACDLMSELFDMYESAPDLGMSQSREHRLLFGADFETLADVSEQFSLGTEYTWNDLLSLRGGYRFGQ
ncbi:MAG: PorV/PorQ family protein, partial [Candidatus Kapabacteria bacterium]|nr:PorV/PorQ family protein [Candidatus Kapabacteria bacterium]